MKICWKCYKGLVSREGEVNRDILEDDLEINDDWIKCDWCGESTPRDELIVINN